MNNGQITPHDVEQAVLGAIMLEYSSLGNRIETIRPAWFDEPDNRAVCTAIQTLRRENKPVDLLSVALQCSGIVTAHKVAAIANKVASGANLDFYAAILRQNYTKREFEKRVSEVLTKDEPDPWEKIKDLRDIISDLELTQETRVQLLRDLVNEQTEKLDTRRNSDIKTVGKRSGFAKLDSNIGGLVGGELLIVAGRPGMGKTSFAVNLGIEHCKAGGGTLLFSIEMPAVSITDRVISAEARIDNQRIRNADLHDYDMRAIRSIQVPERFWINDNSRLNIDQIAAIVKNMKALHNISLVIVDYLQLIHSDSKGKNREQEVAYISGQCKRMAKDADVCVMALAQLSRKVEERTSKVPMLSDLRESGSIEQDADVVLFPYRPEYYNTHEVQLDTEEAELHIAKSRNGSTGFVRMQFIPKLTKYTWE